MRTSLFVNLLFLSVVYLCCASDSELPELEERALKYFNSGQYQQAIDIYSRIITINSEDIADLVAYIKRAEAYLELENPNAAIKDYTKAIELITPLKDFDEYHADFLFRRGLVYDSLGNLLKAVEDYSKVIEMNPDDALRAYNNRAVALSKLGKHKEAIKDCNHYISRDQKWAVIYYVRGVSKIELKDKSGIDDLKIAARMGHRYAQSTLIQAGINWKK